MRKLFLLLLLIPTVLLSQNYLDEKIVNETFVELLNKDRKKLNVNPLFINYSVSDFTNTWTPMAIQPYIKECQKMDSAFADAFQRGIKKYQYKFPDIPLHGLDDNSFESRVLRHFNRKTGYGENMSVACKDFKMSEVEIATYFYQKLKDSKPHYRNMTLKTYSSTHISIYEKEVDGRYYYVICQLLKT